MIIDSHSQTSWNSTQAVFGYIDNTAKFADLNSYPEKSPIFIGDLAYYHNSNIDSDYNHNFVIPKLGRKNINASSIEGMMKYLDENNFISLWAIDNETNYDYGIAKFLENKFTLNNFKIDKRCINLDLLINKFTDQHFSIQIVKTNKLKLDFIDIIICNDKRIRETKSRFHSHMWNDDTKNITNVLVKRKNNVIGAFSMYINGETITIFDFTIKKHKSQTANNIALKEHDIISYIALKMKDAGYKEVLYFPVLQNNSVVDTSTPHESYERLGTILFYQYTPK